MRRLLLLLLLSGCGSDETTSAPPKAPPSPIVTTTASRPATASIPAKKQDPEAYLLSMEGLAQRSSSSADCASMVPSLKRYHEENASVLQSATPDLMREIDHNVAHRERLREAMSALMAASLKCQQEPDFQSLMKEISAK
jgi:hypothetical protein